MRTVVFHYFKTALHVGINFTLAFAFALLLKHKCTKFITEKNLSMLLIVSSACLLIAGIGKLGWSIQTLGGNTPAENLNQTIFLCLSHFGTFLLFTYFILIIPRNKEK